MDGLKRCFRCGDNKPRTEYYRHSAMADGLLGKCIDCTKKDATAHRMANLAEIREYDRMRAANPERRAMCLKVTQQWRQADPRRSAAHSKVARALRNGLLKKEPCVVCGAEKSLAHHESYDEPLAVVWYCQPHHKERHKQMAEETT